MSMTLEEFLKLTENGKIFTITFVKRSTGEVRVMNCRRGVKKGITGKGLKFDPAKKDLLVVYDVKKITPDGRGAFRMIDLNNIITLSLHGKHYQYNNGIFNEV